MKENSNETLIKVSWLKNKSGKKVGEISKINQKLADFLIKKGDVKLVIKEKKREYNFSR